MAAKNQQTRPPGRVQVRVRVQARAIPVPGWGMQQQQQRSHWHHPVDAPVDQSARSRCRGDGSLGLNARVVHLRPHVGPRCRGGARVLARTRRGLGGERARRGSPRRRPRCPSPARPSGSIARPARARAEGRVRSAIVQLNACMNERKKTDVSLSMSSERSGGHLKSQASRPHLGGKRSLQVRPGPATTGTKVWHWQCPLPWWRGAGGMTSQTL